MAATPKHSLDSFGAIQKDVLSLAAREVLPLLLRTQPASERARSALAALSKWDGTMGVAQSEPLILNAWLRELSRRMFADELGEAMMQDFWSQRNMQQPLADILRNHGATGRLVRRCAPAAAGRTGAAAVRQAAVRLAGSDAGRFAAPLWRSGRNGAGAMRMKRAPSIGRSARCRCWPRCSMSAFRRPATTIRSTSAATTSRDEKEPFTNRHAPSLRALYDLADPEKSRFIHSTGQSGNVLSPLYRNFSQRWAEVAYLPMQMRRPSVEKDQLGTLTLEPR